MANFTGAELEPEPEVGDFNSPTGTGFGSVEVGTYVVPPGYTPGTLEIQNLPNVLAYVNRVYDAVAGDIVTWTTYGFSGIAQGEKYPGPGQFDPTQSGSDTSDHTLEAIVDASVI